MIKKNGKKQYLLFKERDIPCIQCIPCIRIQWN